MDFYAMIRRQVLLTHPDISPQVEGQPRVVDAAHGGWLGLEKQALENQFGIHSRGCWNRSHQP